MMDLNKIVNDLESTGTTKLEYKTSEYRILAYKVNNILRIDITKHYDENED